MTTEEVDEVVRALTAVAENLEAALPNNRCRRHPRKCGPMPVKSGCPRKAAPAKTETGLNIVTEDPLPNPVVRTIAVMLDEIPLTPRQNG